MTRDTAGRFSGPSRDRQSGDLVSGPCWVTISLWDSLDFGLLTCDVGGQPEALGVCSLQVREGGVDSFVAIIVT